MPAKLKAKRGLIAVPFVRQHEMDDEKVALLIRHLQAGGTVPPVVVALYPTFALPLDGHHRMAASEHLGLSVDAWFVSGRAFDRLCTQVRDAENYVDCGGTPAMKLAATQPRQTG